MDRIFEKSVLSYGRVEKNRKQRTEAQVRYQTQDRVTEISDSMFSKAKASSDRTSRAANRKRAEPIPKLQIYCKTRKHTREIVIP